jgi:hypothetical protein
MSAPINQQIHSKLGRWEYIEIAKRSPSRMPKNLKETEKHFWQSLKHSHLAKFSIETCTKMPFYR